MDRSRHQPSQSVLTPLSLLRYRSDLWKRKLRLTSWSRHSIRSGRLQRHVGAVQIAVTSGNVRLIDVAAVALEGAGEGLAFFEV